MQLFNHSPIYYNEPLFRPPSEAGSLIFQITLGCSWNKCAFCEMYSSKTFSIKKEEDIHKEIILASEMIPDTRKVFLADGNPMCLSTQKLLNILTLLQKHFPKLSRVTTYALPRDMLAKSIEELKELREAGLKILYVGIESGDDQLLSLVNKGETFKSTVEGLLKAKQAGMKLSTIILSGLGGNLFSSQHAVHSAEILNEIQPEYASTLVLSFPFGIERYQQKFNEKYQPMTTADLLREMKLFISHTNLSSTIYRSNHASNYLALSGILSRDKKQLLEKIKFALNNPSLADLREEWKRGL